MTTDEIKRTVFRVLGEVAPEADPSAIQPDLNLREQLDIDSVDFLNFVIGLHKEFQVEIPEKEYPRLFTLNGCVDYFGAKR